jgi:hypothetical protein
MVMLNENRPLRASALVLAERESSSRLTRSPATGGPASLPAHPETPASVNVATRHDAASRRPSIILRVVGRDAAPLLIRSRDPYELLTW